MPNSCDNIININNTINVNNNYRHSFNNGKKNLSINPIDNQKFGDIKCYQSNLLINLKDNNSNINIEEYLKTVVDDMDYDDALKYDKRQFCEYFLEKIKNNQITLNTFYAKDPLRRRAIKIILFILNIDLYFFINGLFFNEEYISEVFHSKENESLMDFFYRIIDNCLYTTLAGVIINYIIDFFFVEEKKLKGILKREKDNLIALNYEISKLVKNIQKRLLYFIIITFLLLKLV